MFISHGLMVGLDSSNQPEQSWFHHDGIEATDGTSCTTVDGSGMEWKFFSLEPYEIGSSTIPIECALIKRYLCLPFYQMDEIIFVHMSLFFDRRIVDMRPSADAVS